MQGWEVGLGLQRMGEAQILAGRGDHPRPPRKLASAVAFHPIFPKIMITASRLILRFSSLYISYKIVRIWSYGWITSDHLCVFQHFCNDSLVLFQNCFMLILMMVKKGLPKTH